MTVETVESPRGYPHWRLGHRPGLDGVRGVAIAMVVLAHALYPIMPGGGVTGVHLFFGLSGFLITTLLLEEQAAHGRIDVRAFYGRRVRRLLPALLVFVAVYTGAVLIIAGADVPRLAAGGVAATYLANWWRILGAPMFEVGHTWSLAVEEQFYLVWPAVLIALARLTPRAAATAIAAAAIASSLGRAWLFVDGAPWSRIYYGTDLVASSLLFGALAAFAVHYGWVRDGRAWRLAAAAGLAFLAVDFALIDQHGPAGRTFLALAGWTMIGLASAVLVLAVARFDAMPWLSHPWLRYLGRISYALYLWHFAVLWVLGDAGVPAWVELLVGVPLSVLLAELSWRFVERRWLRPRNAEEGRHGRAASAGAGADDAAPRADRRADGVGV